MSEERPIYQTENNPDGPLQIPNALENKTIEYKLRIAASMLDKLDKQTLHNLLLEAADGIKERDAQIWAINDELVKAGLKPYEYESFAACIAVLRERS